MQEISAALAGLLIVAWLVVMLRPPEVGNTPPPASTLVSFQVQDFSAPVLLYAAPPVFVPLDVPLSAGLQQFAACECAAADPPVELEMVLAIIEHESGFDPTVIGHNADGSRDYGLMQVNDSALPMLQEALGIQSMDELLAPETGLRAGILILALHTATFSGNTQAALMAYQSGAAGARGKLESGITSTAFSREIMQRTETLRNGGD